MVFHDSPEFPMVFASDVILLEFEFISKKVVFHVFLKGEFLMLKNYP